MSNIYPVSFISDGKYWAAGEPIPEESVRPFMSRYAEKATPQLKAKGKVKTNNLRKEYGKQYYVNDANEMTSPVVRREMAELEAANAEEEYIEEVASEEPDEVTAQAIEEARENWAAEIERQKLDAQITAEHGDELEESLAEEKAAEAEAGEFDMMDEPPKYKPKQSKRLFVKRNGEFIQASTAKLIKGETLFWYRERALGQTAMFIKHSLVK